MFDKDKQLRPSLSQCPRTFLEISLSITPDTAIMSQVAVTLVKESLVQLGVALTDVTLLYDWGKKVGNFLRAADNDEDLVEVLSEPPEVLLPRSSLIDLNTM